MNDTQQLQSLAPVDDSITPYDRAHFKLYLQLLDAEERDASWQSVATDIMGLNLEEASAKACWQSHLQRAKWMSVSGYRQMLDSPK